MLKCAKNASFNYEPPSPYIIKTHLLPALFDDYLRKCFQYINANSVNFGLSLMCDGATIDKIAYLNFLVCCCSSQFVMKILNCSSDMLHGSVKNAAYIEEKCKGVMSQIDNFEFLFDLVFFMVLVMFKRLGRLCVHHILDSHAFMELSM